MLYRSLRLRVCEWICYNNIVPENITVMKSRAIAILNQKVFIFTGWQVGRFESLKMVIVRVFYSVITVRVFCV